MRRYNVSGLIVMLGSAGLCACLLLGAKPPAPRPAPGRLELETPVATRPALPDAAEQARAEKLVREVFQREYASKDPAARIALARRLLQQAIETRDDAAARYVLQREARDVGAAAGDVATLTRAIALMEEGFGVDSLPASGTALATAQHASDSAATQSAVAEAALRSVDSALERDDLASASRLMALAEAAAGKSKSVMLLSQAQARAKDLHAQAAEFAGAKKARETLMQNPGDAAAAGVLGRYLCLIKGQWESGLPLLARSNDETLRPAAARDLALRDNTGRNAVADAWWEIAQSRAGLARRHLRARAALHYRLALPSLMGLPQSVAEKRLAQIEADEMADLHLAAGLIAELFKDIAFTQAVGVRIDPHLQFDWDDKAPDPALAKDNFSIRWSGLLRVPAGGEYEIVLRANTGARVWIDEKLIHDEPDLTRRRAGVRKPVELSAGLHAIKVEYWDKGGTASLQLEWILPGAQKPEAIPASAFLHDQWMEPRR